MINLYTWKTPNGRKVHIMLEELQLDYKLHKVNIDKDEQYHPDFLKISPNNKIPVITDDNGLKGKQISVFESGAILIYLAEKVKSPLFPPNEGERMQIMQWLMFQMASLGPMLGQAHHFLYKPKEVIPYAQRRYLEETERLYDVLDERLSKSSYLAIDTYSIADIAAYPWICRHPRHQIDLADYPNVKRWHKTLSERPAVRKGMEVI